MKLTPEQIEIISNYVKSFDIKWYELQVEFTDHMVNSIEEIWKNNPKLTLDEVKIQAKNAFGSNGFKGIEAERIKAFQKENKREQDKMVLEYLGFPKIIGSLVLVFVVYKVSYFIEKPSQFIFFINLFLLFLSVYGIYLWIKNRKIEGKRFLVINKFNVYGSMGFSQLGMNVSMWLKDEINQNHLLVLTFCFSEGVFLLIKSVFVCCPLVCCLIFFFPFLVG